LFRGCREDLQRYFQRRLASRETAADLTQETFLRLLRSGQVPELRQPRAFLFRAASNLLADHYRQAAGRSFKDLSEAEWAEHPDPSPSPEATVLSREELEVLKQAIADLPPRGREVLTLHKFEGLSYSEIAERLGIAKNTVVVHMVRALAACRTRINEYRRGLAKSE
jgi:RNA polymerase sigma-70 factor (ECF subfamily)